MRAQRLQLTRGILVEAAIVGRSAGDHAWHAELSKSGLVVRVHGPHHGAKGALLRHERLAPLCIAIHWHACLPCIIIVAM